jgi:hypothetical protein
MTRYASRIPTKIEGRKQPIGYLCGRKSDDGPPLWVVGHYETSCGGGDTIPSIQMVYDQVVENAEKGFDVIYEGLIIQSDVKRCIETAKRFPLLCIALNTSLDDCKAGIQARRDARGDTRPISMDNTIAKAKSLPSQQRRLLAGGVDFRFLNREEALRTVLESLKWI